MVKHVEPDKIFVKMPSLRAVKAFVAAAKYLNFTRAAESLCVSQAAISRQIRELETHLGVVLFKRAGRSVELTEAGAIFYDAAYLSFVNISQAAERIKDIGGGKQVLTVCCTPTLSTFWLSRHLPDFFKANPEIDLNVVTTENFLQMEPGINPDVFINKVADPREGYHSMPLFHDRIYPVCTPAYVEAHPEVKTLEGLRSAMLLNLSPYGRAQIAEHLDWDVWFSFFEPAASERVRRSPHIFNANDYNMLVQMALNHQGVSLGWHHLVAPLVADGQLVAPVPEAVELKEKLHYMTYAENKAGNEAFCRFRDWILKGAAAERTTVLVKG